MTEEKLNPASNAKIFSWILVGVMVPLVAAAMPWLIETIVPSKELLFTFQGPIESSEAIALSIVVQNNGKELEEDIEVWIPMSTISRLEVITTTSGQVKTKDVEPTVAIDTDVPNTIEIKDSNTRIVRIKSLRSHESARITVFVYGGKAIISKYDLENMRVVSKQTVGLFDGQNELKEYMYKVGTWLFAAFFLIGFAWSVYYEWLMPKHKKEEYLMKQIEKL